MTNVTPLLTTPEVQARYGVSRTVVWKWRKAGLLNAIELPGGLLRFSPEELERFERAHFGPADLTVDGEAFSISA